MSKASEFWDRQMAEWTVVSWMASDQVRAYINESIAGDPHAWPLDALVAWAGRTFPRLLSIGCGPGSAERHLLSRGFCERADALDASIGSLAIAMREAEAAGLRGRLQYYAADFNALVLPPATYDFVIVSQALHHVADLEGVYAEILKTLKPGGLLFIDEYVGPSRFEWRESMLREQRAVYDALAADIRAVPRLLLPIQADDPSEAYRSSEILPLLEVGFDVLERRDYGGNLLSVLFPVIDWSKAPAGLVGDLIEKEKALLKHAASFYSLVVAQPSRTVSVDEARRKYRRAARVNRLRFSTARVLRTAEAFAVRVIGAVARRVPPVSR